MKQNKNKFLVILGWLLFLMAMGLFCIQMGYLLLHNRLQMEYIDHRLFYIINLMIVICLFVGLILLFTLKRKFIGIGASILGLFIILNITLLIQSNQETSGIVSVSPDFKHVFSINNDLKQDEAIYYKSYYGIFARPKERLSVAITDDYDVKWLANDVAVFTYRTINNNVQAFVGTYGDRKQGISYYDVGAEMQGVWQKGDVKVESSPEGIQVVDHGEASLFEWSEVKQFGTLAIVLEKKQEANWVIALNEDIKLHSNSTEPPTGSISLYKTTMGSDELYRLKFQSDNE